jgi:threonine/homoserine/homoserine lactone efflux protein
VASSEILQVTAVAAGLTALFAAASAAFTGLRLCGAEYLLYLGVQALRHARGGSPLDAAQTGDHVTGRCTYLRGFATNLVNPKSVTFVVALLPQFVDRSIGHVPLQFAVLGAILFAFEMLVDGTVGIMAGRLGSWPSRQRARQALDASSGAILVALAGRLALERCLEGNQASVGPMRTSRLRGLRTGFPLLAAPSQFPPVKPCMRFFRTRLTGALLRQWCSCPSQSRNSLSGMTVPRGLGHGISRLCGGCPSWTATARAPTERRSGRGRGHGPSPVAEMPGPAAHEQVQLGDDDLDRHA